MGMLHGQIFGVADGGSTQPYLSALEVSWTREAALEMMERSKLTDHLSDLVQFEMDQNEWDRHNGIARIAGCWHYSKMQGEFACIVAHKSGWLQPVLGALPSH